MGNKDIIFWKKYLISRDWKGKKYDHPHNKDIKIELAELLSLYGADSLKLKIEKFDKIIKK